MSYSWRDLLGDLSGYRTKYLDAMSLLDACDEDKIWLAKQLEQRDELVRQLKLMIDRPDPPEISYIVEKDTVWIQEQIDSMGLFMVRQPLDVTYRLTNHSNMLNIVAWDTTDKIKYIKERFDCENFAILFKAMVDLYFHLNQVAIIIDYKSHHGYNLIMFPNGKHMVCEPQSDGLYLWTERIQNFYSMKGAICTL